MDDRFMQIMARVSKELNNVERIEAIRMKQLLVVITLILCVSSTSTANLITKDYGDFTLGSWQRRTMTDLWDLSKGEIMISYQLDFSSIPVGSNLFQIGFAAQGTANWDTGVWLQTRHHGSADTISGGYEVFDMQDHILLQRRVNPASDWPTTNEPAYNVVNPDNPEILSPFGTYKNVGFYYDRGAVTDPVQQGLYGWADGGNYNTQGIYNVELLFKQVSATEGVVFATINGISQGIYVGSSPNYANEPDFYPAGLSFSLADFGGSFSNLQVWFGQGGNIGSNQSYVYNLTVSQVPEPISIAMAGAGIVGVVAGRRKLRRKAE